MNDQEKKNGIPIVMLCGHTLNYLEEDVFGKRQCGQCGHVYNKGISDQAKSVMLAKAMGWEVRETYGHTVYGTISYRPCDPYFVMPDGEETQDTNLYDPANMALAWRVLNWAMDENGVWQLALAVGDFALEATLYDNPLWNLPPADAQRLWLDKILELAIEAGLIEVQDA